MCVCQCMCLFVSGHQICFGLQGPDHVGKMLLNMAQEVCVYSICEHVRVSVSLCGHSSPLIKAVAFCMRKKTRWCSYGGWRREMYGFSLRRGRGWISSLCKYTQCGPYQVLLLYILINASLHTIFCMGMAPVKIYIPPYLLRCYCVQPLNVV